MIKDGKMDTQLLADIKYFTAHALSGLLSNPTFQSEQTLKYLNMKDLTLEKLALLSGIEVVEQLERWKASLTKEEDQKNQIKLALVDADKVID